ncbi:MAG: HAD-IA family hydrolase [bacterium]
MKYQVRAIAFDAVGTLIEANPSVATAYQKAASNAGVELDINTIKSRFYTTFSSDCSGADHRTDEQNERVRWRKIVGQCLPELTESKADIVFAELWEHFASPTNWRLFDDVAQLITNISELNLKMCVASNFDSRLRTVWAELKGVDVLSNHLVISSEAGVRKPGEEFYRVVANHLDEKPADILFVGDDWVNDFKIPGELGFQTIFLDRQGKSGQSTSIKNMNELLQMLL